MHRELGCHLQVGEVEDCEILRTLSIVLGRVLQNSCSTAEEEVSCAAVRALLFIIDQGPFTALTASMHGLQGEL